MTIILVQRPQNPFGIMGLKLWCSSLGHAPEVAPALTETVWETRGTSYTIQQEAIQVVQQVGVGLQKEGTKETLVVSLDPQVVKLL